ncbi:metallophosphoesterase [Aciduricibacillus chroicocephali]|uniref:Phosphoesterase n=1 Tax=Aciduricibacillus chroicocephali TaxID=3054939 RepID=A0ABY9KT31_9BACI|nr:metallophosphoesterase [Bacillaceae bacterium 44XB]
MAKVLVVSDSHGLEEELKEIKQRHGCKYNIHCGDTELDIEEPALDGFIGVRGNCDYDARFPLEHTLMINGKKVLIAHGHQYKVEENIMNLAYRGEEEGADIVCFGHTHVPYAEEYGNLFIINPGSIRKPRQSSIPTYAILDVQKDSIEAHFYNIKGELVPELNRVLTV